MFDELKLMIVGVIIILVLGFAVFGIMNTLGLRHLEDIQENAPAFLKANGFDVICTQGFQTYTFKGSAFVWWTMKREGLIYQCAVMKRRGEYQLYNLKVMNAVNISAN